MTGERRLPLLITVVGVAIISLGTLVPAARIYFDGKLFASVEEDTGMDGAAVAALSFEGMDAGYNVHLLFIDLFASISFRSRLPDLFEPQTRLPRFPMRLFVSRSLQSEDIVSVTWIYQSAPMARRTGYSAASLFQSILHAMDSALKAEKKIGNMKVVSISVPETMGYLSTAIRAWPKRAIQLAIFCFPAYALLVFGARKRSVKAWKPAIVVCVLTVVFGSILISIIKPFIYGDISSSFHLWSQPAWRIIAIERSFTVDTSSAAAPEGISWEAFPETSIFLEKTGEQTEDLSSTTTYRAEYDVEKARGLFRMIGYKEHWLSMSSP